MKNTNTKLVAVTGAGGVLCGTIARSLAEKGFKVALLDKNEGAVKALSEELNAKGCTTDYFACDVLDKNSLEEAKKQINAKLGTVNVLINGAGGNHPKCTTADEFFKKDSENGFFDLDKEGINFVFNLNFLGTFLPSQVFMKDMIDNGGNVINISSMNAFCPLTKIPAYSGAKAAVSNFTQWLAVHFAGTGIRVNAIAPGFFVTAQNQKLLFNEDGTPTARTGKILSQTPMGRFGKPEELLGTIDWLMDDDASSFVTGIVVPIDGGFSAYSGV